MRTKKLLENRSLIIEMFVCLVSAAVFFFVSGKLDILESVINLAHKYENWELDELISTAAFSALLMVGFATRRWLVNRALRKELAKQYAELRTVHEEVRLLKGIVPICASCKKIRDDAGFWQQVEQYIEKHSEAVFSHGLCPGCVKSLYGEESWYKEMDKKDPDSDT